MVDLLLRRRAMICGSPEIPFPSNYTRLAALKRINSSAFFNTGVLADSSLNCDIYFSNISDNGTSNAGTFGIRRLSGNSDTSKVCVYTKSSGYFSAHAVVFGGVDTSNIMGGGCATKFGGNMMKISVRNGKWYEWDRLIADVSDQVFSNSDNCPFFLGTMAKNATTVYTASTNYFAFHEAVFYDANGRKTHRFLPCLDGSNQKGFWDTIVGEFRAVNNQNHWTTVPTYTLRSLRINSRAAAFSNVGAYQSCAAKKGWRIVVCDGQEKFLLTNDKFMLHSGNTFTQTGRELTCSVHDSGWHGNTCWWSNTYADASDFFPLLYVSTDKSNHLLTVYRLAGSDPATCTISLVQKIFTPEGDTTYGSTLYFHNYYGGADCTTFVQTAYTRNSYNSNTGEYEGNVVMYRVFPLPSLNDGSEVTLSESDALAKGDIGFVSTTSNGGWNGKYLFITFLNVLNFYEIDTQGATQLKSINFTSSSSADYIIMASYETEGFSWYEEGGHFVAVFEPTSGNIFDVYADDLLPYAQGAHDFT